MEMAYIQRPTDEELVALCRKLIADHTTLKAASAKDWIDDVEMLAKHEHMADEMLRCGAGLTLISDPFDGWVDCEVRWEPRSEGTITGYISLNNGENEVERINYIYHGANDEWGIDPNDEAKYWTGK
jgi:hypothetical protein